jgi:hypothetical protein
MMMKTTQLPLALLGILSLLAACSGDDKSDGTGGASSGSGGKAGSAAAGASTGGSKASGGGSGSNTGGSGGNTGGFSFAGTGGFNPDDYMCNPAPEVGSDCAADTEPCLNGTDVCSCEMGQWACNDLGLGEGGGPGGGFGEIECPATKPMTGSACGDVIGFCPYGGQTMGCVCVNASWACN